MKGRDINYSCRVGLMDLTKTLDRIDRRLEKSEVKNESNDLFKAR